MKTKWYRAVLLALVVTAVAGITGASAAEKSENANRLATGVEDQAAVALTIYNVNLGLVKDQRQASLPAGTFELRFMDVASQIIPASVQVRSLAGASSLRVLEQNYEYDLLNPQKLLEKYVGKEVKLFVENQYTEREDTLTATLLSIDGGPIFKIGEDISFGHPGRILFPKVPEHLTAKPTLVWLLENSLTKPQRIEATYLTNAINWRADYVLTLNARDDRADLSGWVTIDNKSGAAYSNATLKLVAGDVNRVRDDQEFRARILAKEAVAPKAAPAQFKEEEFFEYHIYTLQRPSTLKNNQAKQISLVTADQVPVKKELVYFGARPYYHSRYGEVVSNQKINVIVEIQNKKENNLGIPLPKGVVRVYKQDAEGSLQFIGEDFVDHTPKDEKIRIKMGNAFDVVGGRKQTDWKKLSADTYEAAFEISVRNHKKEDVVVKVVEPIPGAWTMLSSSHQYKETDAHMAEFTLTVPKDKEVKMTYSVKMRF
ncbi:MAG: DUF4139 domain-containing protein [Deltaproteobacteria bacterium]|nr:DUF4139 domain-containing protein [Deltaproteobacteria bacterium]